MNFLFTSVLVLLIVAPGLAFFRAYYSDRFSIRYSRLTITDQIFRSIVPGITIQAIAVILIDTLFSESSVRLDILGVLLAGAKDDDTIKQSFTIIQDSLPRLVFYHLYMVTMGAVIGWQSRRLVRNLGWDRKFTWLRFDNKWFYLLSGEVLEFSEDSTSTTSLDASSIDFVTVDVLVKVEDGNMLYTGIMFDYELENDGGLKSIQMKGSKRKSSNSKNDQASVEGELNGYYDIKGDILVIPNNQIINLNITYWFEETKLDATNITPVIEEE